MPPKSTAEQKEQLYKVAFDEVTERYMEYKHSSESGGGMRAIDYSKMEGSGCNTANVIRVSQTEFVCDVETTVRRTLETPHPELFKLFLDCYVHLRQVPNTESPDIDKLRRIVGAAYVSRRVYPVTAYFRPKVLDRSKGAKIRV